MVPSGITQGWVCPKLLHACIIRLQSSCNVKNVVTCFETLSHGMDLQNDFGKHI
jgi:hypothetical protein